jgi:hypothetical protein
MLVIEELWHNLEFSKRNTYFSKRGSCCWLLFHPQLDSVIEILILILFVSLILIKKENEKKNDKKNNINSINKKLK